MGGEYKELLDGAMGLDPNGEKDFFMGGRAFMVPGMLPESAEVLLSCGALGFDPKGEKDFFMGAAKGPDGGLSSFH